MVNEFKKMVENLYEANPGSPTGYESPSDYSDPKSIKSDFEKVERLIQTKVIPVAKRYFPKAESGWLYNGTYNTNSVGYGTMVNFDKGTIAGYTGRNRIALGSAEGQQKLKDAVNMMRGEFKEAGPVVFLTAADEAEGLGVTLQLNYDDLLSDRFVGLIYDENGRFQEDFSDLEEMESWIEQAADEVK